MDAETMLATLHDRGQEAITAYNDGGNGQPAGWFSWEIARYANTSTATLTVTFVGDDYDDDGHNARQPIMRRWVLTEIEVS